MADAASGDRLQTSITLEEPHRESCSTCTASRRVASSLSGAQRDQGHHAGHQSAALLLPMSAAQAPRDGQSLIHACTDE